MNILKITILGLLSSGMMLSSCGSNPTSQASVTSSEQISSVSSEESILDWTEIPYSEFKTAFANKTNAPWNHYEGTSAIDNAGDLDNHRYFVVGDLVDGEWFLDRTRSDAGGHEVSGHFILDQDSIDMFENPIYNSKVEKKGNEYRFTANMSSSGNTITNIELIDQYFYGYSWIAYTNDVKTVEMVVTWSTK